MKKIWIISLMGFMPLGLQAMDDEATKELHNILKNTPKFLQIGIPLISRPKVKILTAQETAEFHKLNNPLPPQQQQVSLPKKTVSKRDPLIKRILIQELNKSHDNRGETIIRTGYPDYPHEEN